MPDVKDYHWDKPETDDGALLRYVLSPEVREAYLLFDPEEGKFAYSNIGYEILGVQMGKIHVAKHLNTPYTIIVNNHEQL
jgi:hypothetical protein